MSKEILKVSNLKKYFKTPKGMLHAVDDINFSLDEGKTLGVVGESGCGKSTLGRTILRLLEPTSGSVFFEDSDIAKLNAGEMRKLRQKMQIIFQDPFASLNPRRTVASLIGNPMKIHKTCKNKKEFEERVKELMDTVGLSPRLFNAYPHELDGGRRQRIGVARAIALNPKFIVCDEPVSALDVSIQAQILNLLQELQEKLGLTYIFITHDLSVVNYFSDEIMVMYLGQAVEKASSEQLFLNPLHPYTKALLSAIPVPRIHNKPERILLKGEISSPIDPKPGCRFAVRCPHATEKCWTVSPTLKEIEAGHIIACHLY
ncbi:ATP-binding cassette domain-containing protein [Treponema sp. OMZ 792]|uniref:ABC transporter ATP-binding protein n=1 Tax=unclassified Treponema TaxID=2638727 RepID=UPI0020A25D9F|nr:MULTISPECIES: oligopeptide/dipeptide ABC transporter ATP-binding protein [unclassified Treponema]UTC74935.1 ATP-binding cassette domain-containing protein [Treponema sp. OMZ 792]UTC76711.1 ATP-binding cassette domain-containing protein [Treponema sp. OMZ 799]UTC81329.1 ATP-binding cassette domain-containing protein [Treponema sp. OMZ 798]